MVSKAKVLLADDHPMFRAGVRGALEDHGFEVCAEAANAAAAIAAARKHQPEICLLDVHMPGGGIRAAAQIAADVRGTAIVMLTVSRDDEDLFAALRAGADGYLLKDVEPERLPDLLERVLYGDAAMPAELVSRLIREFRARKGERVRLAGRRPVVLTDRQWQVLCLLQQQRGTDEIAEELEISPVTVRRHVSEVVRKLGAPSRKAALELLSESAPVA
jgi:DNA-binding NarL/FixJ family response regulator